MKMVRSVWRLVKGIAIFVLAPVGVLGVMNTYQANQAAEMEFRVFQAVYAEHQRVTSISARDGERQREEIMKRLEEGESVVCFGWTAEDERMLQSDIDVTYRLVHQTEQALAAELARSGSKRMVLAELLSTSAYADDLLAQLLEMDRRAEVGQELCIKQGTVT